MYLLWNLLSLDLLTIQMLTNAKTRKRVSALNAAARIRGAAMSAHVLGTIFTSGSMIPASVSY